METPNSSMRRVTRSQTAASNNKNVHISKLVEESEQILLKSRQGKNVKQHQQQESYKHSALLDITNNSPIVGLAAGSLLTPSSSIAKKRSDRGKVMTPGTGEALLRGQVKTLLQKVEEEAELSKISLETRAIFPYLPGFASSHMGLLLAPTPANTPQVSNLSEDEKAKNDVDSETNSLNPDQELIYQVKNDMFDGKKHEESLQSQRSLITRSLLLDFSDKSEISDTSECSSVLTQAAKGEIEDRWDRSFTDEDNSSVWSIQVNASARNEDKSEISDTSECSSVLTQAKGDISDRWDKSFTDEDNSSVWSIQVNASAQNEDFEEEAGEEEEAEEYNDDEENEGSVEELCMGIEKMSITAVKFTGKHMRFVYNSDNEIVGQEEDETSETGEDLSSPRILRLKGLPTPKGKHVRFPLMEEDKEVNNY